MIVTTAQLERLRARIIVFPDGRSVPRETYALLSAVLVDTANRAMRKGQRTAWSREDYDAGIDEFDRLAGLLAQHEAPDGR